MNLDGLSGRDPRETAGDSRKAWAKPSITPLRAGRAEAITGSAVFDNTLEMQGS